MFNCFGDLWRVGADYRRNGFAAIQVIGCALVIAIATAANRLRRVPGRSKVVVLLTDGVNNRGRVDPRTAAAAGPTRGCSANARGRDW